MQLVRVSSIFKVPYLDASLGTTRQKDTTVEFFKSECIYACTVSSYIVCTLAHTCRIGFSCSLSIEAMLRCWRKGTNKFGCDGAGKVLRPQITCFTRKDIGLHSSVLYEWLSRQKL
jgi:hypothetical protein